MKYISASEFAGRLGVIPRRVAVLCKEGRIPGAVKAGSGGQTSTWLIPEKAKDPRKENGRPPAGK